MIMMMRLSKTHQMKIMKVRILARKTETRLFCLLGIRLRAKLISRLMAVFH